MIWTKFTVSNTYLGEFLAQLQQEGYSIFIIKGQVSIFIIKGQVSIFITKGQVSIFIIKGQVSIFIIKGQVSIFIIKGQVSIFIIKGMIIYEFLPVSSCLNVMQILSFKPFKQSRPGVLICSLMYAVVVLKDKGFNKVMITTYINTI